MVLTNRINYEYFLYANISFYGMDKELTYYNETEEHAREAGNSLVKENSPFLNDYGINRFVGLIINKVLKGNLPAYDFETQQKLSPEQVKQNLGYQTDTILTENAESGTMEEKVLAREINLKDIQSLIFHEEWYIDPMTLRMQKKVIGISPVRYVYKEDDLDRQKPIRQIAFTIYFDEKNKF
jgi:hypothetical protein